MGGVLVDPAHNLKYVEGSSSWASVIPMSLDGLSRAFHLDLTPYLSEYGQELLKDDESASITDEKSVPGLTWAELAKPQYPTPETIPVFVRTANKLIMGAEGTPTVPLLIGQGNGGEELEGTPGDKPGIGPGDGVMIAGDVRSLAREYCERGVRRALHRIPAPRAHRGRGALAHGNRGLARRSLHRPGSATGLLGNRGRQFPGADQESKEIAQTQRKATAGGLPLPLSQRPSSSSDQ